MRSQLFEVLDEAVTVRDLCGELVFANRAALGHLGFDSLEELRRRQTPAIMEEYIVEDEHGVPLRHDDIPSVRLIEGQPVSPVLMRVVHRATGERSWSLLKASPLRDDDGTLVGAITVIEDVTAVNRSANPRVGRVRQDPRVLARLSAGP